MQIVEPLHVHCWPQLPMRAYAHHAERRCSRRESAGVCQIASARAMSAGRVRSGTVDRSSGIDGSRHRRDRRRRRDRRAGPRGRVRRSSASAGTGRHIGVGAARLVARRAVGVAEAVGVEPEVEAQALPLGEREDRGVVDDRRRRARVAVTCDAARVIAVRARDEREVERQRRSSRRATSPPQTRSSSRRRGSSDRLVSATVSVTRRRRRGCARRRW